MGADIYLRSVNKVCREKWQPIFNKAAKLRNKYPRDSAEFKLAQEKVSEAYNGVYSAGYFRDCYNGYGLFAQTPLSWWRNITPMLDEWGNMPVARLAEFRRLVAEAPIDVSAAEQVAREQRDDVPPDGWLAYYEQARADLLALVDQALALGEQLYMSL